MSDVSSGPLRLNSDRTRANCWRVYAEFMAGLGLRRANVIEEPRLHVDRRSHAGAGHRREHGYLFSDRSDPSSSSAGGKAGRAGGVAGARAEDREGVE